jgi:hypothetical protein
MPQHRLISLLLAAAPLLGLLLALLRPARS